MDVLTKCCASSKRIAQRLTHVTLFDVNIDSLKNISDGLNLEVPDECNDPNAIHQWNRFKREVIKKPNYYKNHSRLTEEK